MLALFDLSLTAQIALVLLTLVVIDSVALLASMYFDRHHPLAKPGHKRQLSRRATEAKVES
jgi:hypothetical protein